MPSVLSSRQNANPTAASSSPSGFNPIYIAGFAVVGVIVLGLILWLGLRCVRRRAANKREDARGAAFLSVKGLVREGEAGKQVVEKAAGNGFSRAQLTASVVLPERFLPLPAPTASREDIVSYHRESGHFPKPFAFAMSAGRTPSPVSPNRSSARGSWLSFHVGGEPEGSIGSRYSRFSVMSTSSSVASTTTGTGHARKVRQGFNPVLPDELTIALGETLTVVQSFDDGWCVVGRKSTAAPATLTPFSKPKSAEEQDGVELGVVPAYAFIKPMKGLRAERPMRSTSLGITVQMEGPAYSSRDDMRSWSNF